MTQDSVETRLAALSNREGGSTGRIAADLKATSPTGPRKHRDKFRTAVALATDHGLGLNAVTPPMFRALVAVGLPVQPLHYLSAKTLFLIGLALGFAIFGGIYGAGLSSSAARGSLAGIEKVGWPGAIMTALFIGIGLAFAIRRQAKKHDLPKWSDI